MDFDTALAHVLVSEGGYANHPADPGGETNLGITQRTARAHGYKGAMRDLPMAVAARIYRESFWDQCHCDELPKAVRLVVFDAAVNSGAVRSIRWLQEALKVTATGRINTATLNAAAITDPRLLVNLLLDLRLRFLQGLKTWPTFRKGWQRRIERVRSASLL